jgi:hypothetical protein
MGLVIKWISFAVKLQAGAGGGEEDGGDGGTEGKHEEEGEEEVWVEGVVVDEVGEESGSSTDAEDGESGLGGSQEEVVKREERRMIHGCKGKERKEIDKGEVKIYYLWGRRPKGASIARGGSQERSRHEEEKV